MFAPTTYFLVYFNKFVLFVRKVLCRHKCNCFAVLANNRNKYMKKTVLPILLATIWVSISEFVRNTFFLHQHWVEHYQSLGIVFPEKPINGAVWGLWSLLFAVSVFILNKKFSLLQTTFLSWLTGFVFMWLVIGNMGVLPMDILPFAIPLSILEAFVASYIVNKLSVKPIDK